MLIPRLDHGATKGIQIAENEKVTALVRGVENGAKTLEKKGQPQRAQRLTEENPGAATREYAESCKLLGVISV